MSTANRGPVPPWGLAVAAMISVQLSSALSVGLIAEVGPAGTAWLRLSMGAIIFLAIARPPLRSVRRHDVLPLLGLGVATGLMTIMFLGAVERIPLGTTVAIEFLGPLTVAAVRSHNRRALAWPLLALLGVVLLTEPWHGQVDLLGVMFAAIAAAGWGAYILLTQKIGDRFTGIGALSLTVPIAAVTAAVVGIPQAVGHLDLRILAGALGVAVLMPVLPFVLELKALRRMTSTAFGTLMSLEPAFGVLLGLLVLHQQPSLVQFLGIALVVFAGAASQRGGTRNAPPLAEPTTLGPAPEVASSTGPTKEA
ncbi:inner membrane transporter RhtA [Arthrobacter sp. yr096]|uniref:EamA family transporter n=1 Tax=Arthrobacter sp. yr096 TaxID=1761750 RepID=UPI0008ACCC63|nr:EamA family transporter [Arthrobacter sp. yr096]SEJ54674.1 inner membrane transporter RhtA [Arthrobacter sp. yr096]